MTVSLHVSTAESLSTRQDLQGGRGRAKHVCSGACYLVVSKDGMCGVHSLRENMVYMHVYLSLWRTQ